MNHDLSIWVLAAAFFLGAPRGVAAESKTAAPAPASPEDAYQLNVQDKLIFSIREDPIKSALPDEVFVNAKGDAYFRTSRGSEDIITINVRGKTLSQVKEELKKALDKDYYYNATIDLKLKDQTRRQGQELFMGQVSGSSLLLAPGERKTIFDGVTLVGTTKFANLKKIRLSRFDPATGKTEIRTIDLEKIKKGNRSEDIELQDGDRIEVPEKSFLLP